MKSRVSVPKRCPAAIKESPKARRRRLDVQRRKAKIAKEYGVSLSRFDDGEDCDFLSPAEREAYEKDCLFFVMFLNAGTEPPDDLKTRLLEVKQMREARVET